MRLAGQIIHNSGTDSGDKAAASLAGRYNVAEGIVRVSIYVVVVIGAGHGGAAVQS